MTQPENGRIHYEEQAELLKALANPVRLQIVHNLLRTGCHNVGCMERGTGMSQSCISQHLQRLRAANIVTAERSGNEMLYRVSSPSAARVAAALFEEESAKYVL